MARNKTLESQIIGQTNLDYDVSVSVNRIKSKLFDGLRGSFECNNHNITISGVTSVSDGNGNFCLESPANAYITLPDLETISSTVLRATSSTGSGYNTVLHLPKLISSHLGAEIGYGIGRFKQIHFYSPLQYLDLSTAEEEWFHIDDSNTPPTLGTEFIKGTSKMSATGTYYTDNTSLKNTLKSFADSYTTVNVYHLNGRSW